MTVETKTGPVSGETTPDKPTVPAEPTEEDITQEEVRRSCTLLNIDLV